MHILMDILALAVFGAGVYGMYRLVKKNGDL
jgi:hypothetical protein